MSIRKPIDALFPKIRQMLLSTILMHPDRWWYMNELSNHLDVRSSSLQRELRSLVEAGILVRRKDGNRIFYRPDPSCPFLSDLQSILLKTTGLTDVIREILLPFANRIQSAFIFGSLARSEEFSGSDVDLMIIGRVGLSELSPTLRDAEERLNRSINPMLYTPKEFARKLKAGHHFLSTVIDRGKIFVIGTEDGLAETVGSQSCEKAHPKQG